MNHTEISWMGYKRKDGRKGIRNRVLVIYTVKCAEHVARKIVDEVHHPEVELLGFDGCTDNQYDPSSKCRCGAYGWTRMRICSAGMAGKDRTSGRENFILDPDPG